MTVSSPAGRLVVVAGLPGAGKSTLLARIADLPGPPPRVVDPDLLRHRLARRLPGVPYRAYRAVVHALHGMWTLLQVVRGPRDDGDVLFVHATTRRSRQDALARLARAAGWNPSLVVIDVPVRSALEGQADRGRVVGRHGFARHVRRYQAARAHLNAVDGRAAGPWEVVRVVARGTALRQVRGLVQNGGTPFTEGSARCTVAA